MPSPLPGLGKRLIFLALLAGTWLVLRQHFLKQTTVEPLATGVTSAPFQLTSLPDFLDPSLPLFVSLGRLTKQKGMDRLISCVTAMGSKANLLIIGQGPERDELERLIENNGLIGRAKIIDFQDNKKLFIYGHSSRSKL